MQKLFFFTAAVIFILQSHAQNVGIGTTVPRARLHVLDSAVLFSGPVSLPVTAGAPPVTGSGTRMMWYPNKAAFRAGAVTGTQWDEAGIGKYSVSFGLNNRAAGDYANSIGWGNSASGNASFSSGFSNIASGKYATAFGENVDALAYASLVIGRYNVQNGNTDAWIDTDPLFVVGNGYTYDPGNGTQVIQRRNAFSVKKSGETTINGPAAINGNATFSGESAFNDTTRFNENVGINLLSNEKPATSLMLNGAVTVKPSSAFINAANDYEIDVTNKTFIRVAYSEDFTIVPIIKLTGSSGSYGQIIILTGSGYPFKVATYNGSGSHWIAVPSTRTIANNVMIMLINNSGRWCELSYSNNNF